MTLDASADLDAENNKLHSLLCSYYDSILTFHVLIPFLPFVAMYPLPEWYESPYVIGWLALGLILDLYSINNLLTDSSKVKAADYQAFTRVEIRRFIFRQEAVTLAMGIRWAAGFLLIDISQLGPQLAYYMMMMFMGLALIMYVSIHIKSIFFTTSVPFSIVLVFVSLFTAEPSVYIYAILALYVSFYLTAVMIISTFHSMVVKDITLIKEKEVLNERLQMERDGADLATNKKSHFIAAASHDLRQPIQSLRAYSSVLKDTYPNDDEVAIIDRTSRQLSDLVNNLMDISFLETGRVHIDINPIRLHSLFAQLEEEFRQRLLNKHLTLKADDQGLMVYSDHTLFYRILVNLLDNAIKFSTFSDVITLSAKLQGDQVTVMVMDNGRGIAQEHHQHIFDELFQVDNRARNHHYGFGIGLSVCKRLTELLDHSITVDSNISEGACFNVTLKGEAVTPLHLLDDDRYALTKRAQSLAILQGASVLLLEDSEPILNVMELILTQNGMQVNACSSAASAQSALNKFNPDIFVFDNRLPGDNNGTDLVPIYREQLNKEIPVIILSGDIQCQLDHLSNAVMLTKPVENEQLLAAIAQLLQRQVSDEDDNNKDADDDDQQRNDATA